MKINGYQLPWAIMLAGVAYSLYLLWLVPNGVFFSGDGGLKALLAQQLSTGELRFDLAQPTQEWVLRLWQEGLYPYEPPFVYAVDSRYFISFPFTFSLVTAPFYGLFGERGLYFIPLAATWAIWITFYFACRRLKFSSLNVSLALLILIFTSNLTLYSAMYWEHTLAIALCFSGMAMLLIPPTENGLSIPEAILSGCLVGSSVWVRSEMLAMVVTLCLLIYFISLAQKLKIVNSFFNLNSLAFLTKNRELFVGSMFLTIGLFFVCNQLIYGSFLGIHSRLILDDFSWTQRLAQAWLSFQEMAVKFFVYFPVAIFPVLYLLAFCFQKIAKKFNIKTAAIFLIFIFVLSGLLLFVNKGTSGLKIWIGQGTVPFLLTCLWIYALKDRELKLTAKAGIIYIICLFFTIGVALLVDYVPGEIAVGGKQWGSRYLLILLPLVTWLAAGELKTMRELPQTFAPYLGIFTISLLILLGSYQNLYLGTGYFFENYQGVTPAIQALRETTERVVAVSHQYAAQMLELSLQKEKIFFRAEDSQDLVKLSSALIEQGEDKFIYLCYPYRKCKPPEDKPENLLFNRGDRRFQILLSNLGKFGKYPIYEVSIQSVNWENYHFR